MRQGSWRALAALFSVIVAVGCNRDRGARNCLDWYAPNAASQRLLAMGLQGGGPSFAGVIYGHLRDRSPAVLERLDFDDEADGVRVCSRDPAALAAVRAFIAQVEANPSLLQPAVDRARRDGRME